MSALPTACPKPERTPPKARKPIKTNVRPPRGKKPKPVNRQRRTREKLRTNGSAERDAFVRALPCCACGVVGFSEVAHVGNEGAGAGRKANADQTAPLCGPRIVRGAVVRGCHRASHKGQKTFEAAWNLNLADCAAETQRRWQAHLAATGGEL